MKRRPRKIYQTVTDLIFRRQPGKASRLIDEYLKQFDPNDPKLLILKGNTLDLMARYDQAAKLYRKVLQMDPENRVALIDLGDSYSRYKEEYRKAIPYYDRALRLIESRRVRHGEEDELIDACVGKADALLELHRPMAALRCIIHGLQRHPSDIVLGDALNRAQEQYHRMLKQRARKPQRRTRQRSKRRRAR